MFELPQVPFDALIFDCDGTLVDSMPVHHKAWRKALWENGARFDFSWDLFVSRAGMGLPETVLALNAQFGVELDPAKVIAAQHFYYEASIPELGPVEPVVAFARQYYGRVPMAVASGGGRHAVLRSLQLLNLEALFDPILCREDVVKGKPDPEMFLACAKRMRVVPERCIVFEDGEMGILAAAAAGMFCVRVPSLNPNPGQ